MFTQTVNVNAEEINQNHGLTATARPQEKHYHKKKHHRSKGQQKGMPNWLQAVNYTKKMY